MADIATVSTTLHGPSVEVKLVVHDHEGGWLVTTNSCIAVDVCSLLRDPAVAHTVGVYVVQENRGRVVSDDFLSGTIEVMAAGETGEQERLLDGERVHGCNHVGTVTDIVVFRVLNR